MTAKEQYLYPLIEEKLEALGKLTPAYKQRSGDFVPDFILETEENKRIAVKVGYETQPRHLAPKTLSQKAFQLLVYLHQFDKVLYIAPYEELQAMCALLEQAGVKIGEKLQTADLGYTIGVEALDKKLQKIALEFKKIKRCFRDHGYKL
jgi:hypothetical protein